MNLKDRETGEIKTATISCGYEEETITVRTYKDDNREASYKKAEFRSLAELNAQYEDAPEEIKPFEEVAKAEFEINACVYDFSTRVLPPKSDGAEEAEVTLRIADIDYYEILPDGTMKTKFTWGEAMEIEKKTDGKWRVPTQAEWFAITAAFGKNEAGEVTGETLAKNLNLTTDEAGYGYYWSSTPSSYTDARYLHFNSTYVNPQNSNNKTLGFTVRCVAR